MFADTEEVHTDLLGENSLLDHVANGCAWDSRRPRASFVASPKVSRPMTSCGRPASHDRIGRTRCVCVVKPTLLE